MSAEKEHEKEQNKVNDLSQEARCIARKQFMSLKVKTILKVLLSSVAGPLILYGVLLVHQRYQTHTKHLPGIEVEEDRPRFWVYARHNDTGYLTHVRAVLSRLGFRESANQSGWDLLWAHDYPFRKLAASLHRLQRHQRVNHFPGCGYVTNKVDLSMSPGRYIPTAFRMPDDRERFLRHVAANPDKKFVQKSNDHRGIRLVSSHDANLTADGIFVQEFVERPYLVDGYKFDIGLYIVITSVDPLRLYVYQGDVLFRFCPVAYYPFDAEDLDKYVVGDDYLPIWKVPSLKKYYAELGYSMKDSFDAYVREQGKDPAEMWERAYDAIREVFLMKESQIREISKRVGNGRNFFELMRFDLVLDEDLNVYTMEANMSPNLSSAHYPPNQLLYEQVIFNTLALVGVGKRIRRRSLKTSSKAEEDMEVADKNIVVLPELCRECDDCFRVECQLCRPCFTPETRLILSQSYLEHQNRMDFQRIFPPSIRKDMVSKDYTLRNQLLIRWYQGKCEMDKTWCI
ncbi:probable tubulin polyglutamylase ttll-15 [Odontomachus brunneus]|uniref:probable tubulin polyglutamylase ttll-15 n=1 Tax=Odontomachus brunneus TaxID=486640 RepID=UPI0013F27999|nr:probable tubulin polyglutamylase ttll-15 [Odontomachus brunneus]